MAYSDAVKQRAKSLGVSQREASEQMLVDSYLAAKEDWKLARDEYYYMRDKIARAAKRKIEKKGGEPILGIEGDCQVRVTFPKTTSVDVPGVRSERSKRVKDCFVEKAPSYSRARDFDRRVQTIRSAKLRARAKSYVKMRARGPRVIELNGYDD